MAWAMRQPQRKGVRQANQIPQLAAYRARRVSSLRQPLLLLPSIFALVFRKRALLFYNPTLQHRAPYAVTPQSVAVCEATVFKESYSCGCLYHTTLETFSIQTRACVTHKWRDRPRRSEAESSQAEPARLNATFIVLTLSSDVCMPDHCANLEDTCGHDLQQAESCMIGVPVVQQKRVRGSEDALALFNSFWFTTRTSGQ